MDDVLHVEIDGPVATVWLNRPQVRNALNALLIGGLREAMATLDANADVAKTQWVTGGGGLIPATGHVLYHAVVLNLDGQFWPKITSKFLCY